MAERPTRITVRPLLTSKNDAGVDHPITTPAEWAAKKAKIRAVIEQYLGQGPAEAAPAPNMHIYQETETPLYRQLLVGYEVERGEEVKAHLLIPPAAQRRQGAAVLCLHGTSVGAKDTQIYGSEKPGRDYGRFLAEYGFITLSPDHACAGERQPAGYRPYDSTPFQQRHPQWSMVGKAIWDGQRAVDILCQLDEVDPERIGAVGHSLGGYGSIFLAACEERVKAIVSSCGLTVWEGNPKRIQFARDEWYVHFPALRQIFLRDEAVPFDMHEFASLVAPRAFLNISGMADTMYSAANYYMPEVGWQLYRVYELLGAGEHFANFLFGGGHDVPQYSRALTAAWLERWLTSPRPDAVEEDQR